MECSGMQFDRFDICEAYYVFAVDNHKGQGSKEYAIFGRLQKIGFKPAPFITENGYKALTENGKTIYQALVKKQKGDRP